MILMALAPLLVSILFLSVSLMSVLKHHTKAYSLCYQTGIHLQKKLKKQIQSLLKLNSKAQMLRNQRRINKTLFYVTLPNLKSIANEKARKNLKRVQSQQKELRDVQTSILNASRIVIKKNWMQYKLKSRKWVRSSHKKQIQSPLAVTPFPKNSDSPSYKLSDKFKKNQNITISWKMDVFKFIPSWVQNTFKWNSYSKHGCAVSLNKNLSVQLMKTNF